MLRKICSILIVCILFGCSLKKHNRAKSEHIAPTNRFYKVRGKSYCPQRHYYYNKVGLASFYKHNSKRSRTSCGAIFNHNKLTAAHRTLPIPCWVKVTNLKNGRFCTLLVNDRGPFKHINRRLIDVSFAAAKKLNFVKDGITKVRIVCLGPAKH